MHNFLEKLGDYWWQLLVGLLSSWILIRQKAVRDEHNSMKADIEQLKLDHTKLDATLANVKKNQELMREVQTEMRNDIKILISRRTEDTKKRRWFL